VEFCNGIFIPNLSQKLGVLGCDMVEKKEKEFALMQVPFSK